MIPPRISLKVFDQHEDRHAHGLYFEIVGKFVAQGCIYWLSCRGVRVGWVQGSSKFEAPISFLSSRPSPNMPLWAALRFVQWEDTISFHARLFRCFFLGLLDAHSELAVFSQGSEWVLAVLGQQLADVGLMHDVGHLHEPISHRASPSGRHSDTTRRCPPKKRYTSLPSFAVTSPTDPTVPLPPFIFSHPINFTHGLYDESIPPAVGFVPPGSIMVLLLCLASAYPMISARFRTGFGRLRRFSH